MARYNLQRYNRHKYNVYTPENREGTIWRERLLFDRIEAVVGLQKRIFNHTTLNDEVYANAHLVIAFDISPRTHWDTVEFTGYLRMSKFFECQLSDVFLLHGHVGKKINYTCVYLSSIFGDMHVGKIANYDAILNDDILIRAYLTKYVLFGYELVDIILSFVSAYTILIFTGIITGTIRPGDLIEFNSKNYTATQNGANIIHLYSGDWIFVTPELIDITIATSNARMTGEIVYTEQFI